MRKLLLAIVVALAGAAALLEAQGVRIMSGSSSDLVGVGAASKAGRVTPYDDAGNSLAPAELARGNVNIVVRQTAATAAGACVWGLRNSGATRTIAVLRVAFSLSFDGTGAASLMRYELVKGTSVSAFSGGVAVTPSINKTSLTAGTHVDARILDTGLTTTGLVAGGALYTATWARLTFSATQAGGISGQHVVDFAAPGMGGFGPLELAQNEILCLRNGPTNASVVGDTVLGAAWFIER